MHLSIVIPCYKEEASIVVGVQCLQLLCLEQGIVRDQYEIILVVEKSDTATLPIAEELASSHHNIRVFANDKCYGKGYSVRRGVLESSGRYVLVVDADVPINLSKYMPLLLTLIEYDEVGAVYCTALAEKIDSNRRGLIRSLASLVLFIFRVIWLKQHISDTQLGCKLYKGEVARMSMHHVTETGFLYELQLTDILISQRYVIEECTVRIHDFSKESSVTLGSITKNLFVFIRYVLSGRKRIKRAIARSFEAVPVAAAKVEQT